MSTSKRFALLVPVKTPALGKSRLDGFARDVRRALARAFALDTVAAATGSAVMDRLVVVTDDVDLADAVAPLGCDVFPDEGGGDLNAAVRSAARRLDPLAPVAVLLGDLPCLVSADLDAALETVDGRSFVADAAGTGTTLLAASRGVHLEPCFGSGSRQAHLATGAVEIGLAVPTLRLDVDTSADLEAARSLGLGRHTRGVLG